MIWRKFALFEIFKYKQIVNTAPATRNVIGAKLTKNCS